MEHHSDKAGFNSSWFPLFARGYAAYIGFICTNQQVDLVTFPGSLVISSGAGWRCTMKFPSKQLDWISGALLPEPVPFLLYGVVQ
jgi:hypothetical protein